MELDDLRQLWATQDRRLDEMLRLNRQALRTTQLTQARSAMQRVRAGLGIGLVLDGVALVALGAFIGAHLAEPRFLLPAAVLYLTALGTLVTTIRQWVMAGSIHHDAPVTTLQRSLEALRVSRIRTTQVLLLLTPLLWTPLLIIGLQAGFGADAYELLGANYLIVNLLVGLAFVPTMLWASRRFEDRLGRSPFVQRLARDVAGRSLISALEQLETLAAFEREELTPGARPGGL